MKKGGFTLIELLVVIAIIALLTSVVSALITEARNDARNKAFRQNVNQVITAMELYKSDHGVYPGEDFYSGPTFVGMSYYRQGPNGAPVFHTTGMSPSQIAALRTEFESDLADYIPTFPVPPTQGAYFQYYNQNFVSCEKDGILASSGGTAQKKPYLLLVSANQPGFEDWGYIYIGSTLYNSYRCFSL